MTTKTKLKVSGLLLIVSAFSLLWLFVSFAMLPIFMAKFDVANETNHMIKVTPFGRYEGTSILGPLPTYLIPFPSIKSWFDTNFKIAPKEKREIWFDSDDTFLKGFIILTHDGQYNVMPVDYPQQNYMAITDTTFVVTATTPMQSADQSFIEITKDNKYLRLTIIHLFLLIGLLNIPYFLWLLVRLAREE